jgi:hypothetical protein
LRWGSLSNFLPGLASVLLICTTWVAGSIEVNHYACPYAEWLTDFNLKKPHTQDYLCIYTKEYGTRGKICGPLMPEPPPIQQEKTTSRIRLQLPQLMSSYPLFKTKAINEVEFSFQYLPPTSK